MAKFIKIWKYRLFKYLPYLFKRHFLNQILTGRFLKPGHALFIRIKSAVFKTPWVGIIETGIFCNLKCATCPTPHHKIGRTKRNMTFKEFKEIIDKISPYCHVVLLYNSNEPLLHPELDKMIAYADNKNLYAMISTNATLLDEAMTDKLLNSGLDEILVCLDGMSAASYEPFRVGADFAAVKKNIEYFCQEKRKRKLRKPYVEMQYILTKLNQSELPLMREFVKQNRIDRLHVKSLSISGVAYSPAETRELSAKFLPQTSGQNREKIRYEQTADGSLNIIRPKDWSCPLIGNQIMVLADGSISMCCHDIQGQYLYGNLLSGDFRQIWNSRQAKSLRAKALQGELPLCKICGAR